MLVFLIWFTGFNIASTQSQSDILDGFTAVVVCAMFAALGIYAHRLAFKLFIHPKFMDMMRLHSKTVAKLNAAVLVFVMMSAFIVAVNLHLSAFVYGYTPVNATSTDANSSVAHDDIIDTDSDMSPCQTIDIPLWICQTYFLSQVVYSFFFLLWNGVVAMVLISVARTHTVSIRRLICQLDCDAYLIDKEIRLKNNERANSHDNLYRECFKHAICCGFPEKITKKMYVFRRLFVGGEKCFAKLRR